MKTAINYHSGVLKTQGRLALVVSRFNEVICDGLLQGAQDVLEQAGYGTGDYQVFRVPGAFEIPIVAKRCALSGDYAGVICLGAVIQGGTPHFDYICEAATRGILQAGLDTGIPVICGVITTHTWQQAVERSSPNEFNKGREAALCVLEMIPVLAGIRAS